TCGRQPQRRAGRPRRCGRAGPARQAAPILQHGAPIILPPSRAPLAYATFRKLILAEFTVDVHAFGRESPPGAPVLRRKQSRHARGRILIESREGTSGKRRAGSEDVEIGRKIRALRLQRGLSQTSLADGIGLTFQQVQKYEKGTNRVSAGRLQKIADMLDT